MSCDPLDIEAEVTGLGFPEGALIRGQVAVASTPGRVQRVWLRPVPGVDQARGRAFAVAVQVQATAVKAGLAGDQHGVLTQ